MYIMTADSSESPEWFLSSSSHHSHWTTSLQMANCVVWSNLLALLNAKSSCFSRSLWDSWPCRLNLFILSIPVCSQKARWHLLAGGDTGDRGRWSSLKVKVSERRKKGMLLDKSSSSHLCYSLEYQYLLFTIYLKQSKHVFFHKRVLQPQFRDE